MMHSRPVLGGLRRMLCRQPRLASCSARHGFWQRQMQVQQMQLGTRSCAWLSDTTAMLHRPSDSSNTPNTPNTPNHTGDAPGEFARTSRKEHLVYPTKKSVSEGSKIRAEQTSAAQAPVAGADGAGGTGLGSTPDQPKQKLSLRELFTKHGPKFLVYYTGVWLATGFMLYAGVNAIGGDIVQTTLLEQCDKYDFQYLGNLLRDVKPQHANVGVAIAVNEVMEVVRLPFSLITYPLIFKPNQPQNK
eukprot:m.359799 g.359799  ORF g.359799 m.359799 type:complete len:245 (-) comp18740_c0_seq1:96-830(-)